MPNKPDDILTVKRRIMGRIPEQFHKIILDIRSEDLLDYVDIGIKIATKDKKIKTLNENDFRFYFRKLIAAYEKMTAKKTDINITTGVKND